MGASDLKERIRYKFDNFMSRGAIAMIGGLALLVMVLVLLAALLIYTIDIRPAESSQPVGFIEAVWSSLMRTLDPGTMGDDRGWAYRWVMFGVTIGGVFIISTLIGVVSSGIEDKLSVLRKGRSRVIESGHTVILGWSTQIFSVISELVIANQNQKDPCIVIMGPFDKVVMEDEIRLKVGDTGRTRIVCRTGNPIDLTDLRTVNLPAARSVILISPEKENPDADVIKAMLAIVNNRDRSKDPYHIVAEIRNPRNVQVARMVGKDEVNLILVSDLISRIIAQTCRQSGLSVVYRELLDFSGDEIYFKSEPSLSGYEFSDALFAYEDSTVIGIKYKSGNLKLNPPMDTRLTDGDQIIAISEDDDTIRLSSVEDLKIQKDLIQNEIDQKDAIERILLLGWNRRAPTIVRELDNYVLLGSKLTIASHLEIPKEDIERCCQDVKNLSLDFRSGNTSDRTFLEDLEVGGFKNIVVLSYSDYYPEQDADAITLITLLHLRDLANKHQYDYAIVSEMLDVRNRELAEITRADDFIVSDELASLMLTQVSENKYLNAVFADLFDTEGSEIYLKPAEIFVKLHQSVNFYTVIESASLRGMIPIGYRISSKAARAEEDYGVVVNPKKSNLIRFEEGDQIIVLSDD